MKSVNLFKLAIPAMLLASGSVFAGPIDASSHDLAGTWAAGDNTQLCVYCHAPHNASTDLTAPLWNKNTTVSVFNVYDSGTMEVTPGQPGNVSKACLSCHDGTIAVDQMLNAPLGGGANIGTSFVTGNALVGTDLSNDHPIGMSYAVAAGTDSGLVALAPTSLPIFGANVECASCHDVHVPGPSGFFLRIENAGSALCADCHTK